MKNSGIIYQYGATLCGNVIAIAYGSGCGWPSAAYSVLNSNAETPLQSGSMNVDELSWMVSLMCIGGFIGNIFYGCITNRYGRKLPLLSLAMPMTISWCLIIYATSPVYLYAARMLCGFAGAGAFIFLPLFVAEISEDRVRGSLGSLLVLSCNIGILIAFTCGNYLNYTVQPVVLVALPILFFVTFSFFPESPQYLMKIGKEEEAEQSLRFYRNVRPSTSDETEPFKSELEKLRLSNQTLRKSHENTTVTWSDLTSVSARKAITIGVVLVWLNQFCGCFAMLNYTANIFAESGSNLSPNMSAIIVGIIQLFGAYMSTFLVDRAGRKILFTISSGGTAIGLSCLGSYTYLKTLGFAMDGWSWIPIVSFSFCIFIASWGVLTLPFLVIAELTPEKIRGIGTSICMALLWIFAFLMIKYLPILSGAFGMHGCMGFFASCSFVGCLFCIFVLPETKGKSFEEILRMLEG